MTRTEKNAVFCDTALKLYIKHHWTLAKRIQHECKSFCTLSSLVRHPTRN